MCRDLKSENLLICPDAQPEDQAAQTLKLVDFGSCIELAAGQTVFTEDAVCGSTEYIGPEVWALQYSKAVDIWAAGCLAYELKFGHSPFHWVASRVGELFTSMPQVCTTKVPPHPRHACHVTPT